MPTKHEQELIVKHVKSDTDPIVLAISRLGREVELLREYCTRPVTDAVTGKLDVREAAARMPYEGHIDTVEEDTGLDEILASADEEAAV